MLNLFRNNTFGGVAAVVVFSLLYLGLQYFFAPLPLPVHTGDGLFVKGWLQLLHSTQTGIYVSMGISFLLTLVMGFIFNSLINHYEVLFRQSYFPALFFVYFTHLFPGQGYLSAELLALFFVFLQISRYITLNTAGLSGTPFLDIGLLGGIAFFFSPDALFFIPAIFFGLAISGHLTFKVIVFLFTGFSLPVYFTGVVYYLTDNWADFLGYFVYSHFAFAPQRFLWPWQYLVVAGFVFTILFISLLGITANFNKNTIRSRRLQQGLLLFFICSLGPIILSTSPVYQSFTFMAIPISPFVSYYFLKTKKVFLRETLFALFFIISIIATFAYQLAK